MQEQTSISMVAVVLEVDLVAASVVVVGLVLEEVAELILVLMWMSQSWKLR